MLPVLETPTYEIELPSTKEKLKYRPFLVKEHKLLMTLQDSDIEEVRRVLNELIKVCTFNKIEITSLANFDIEYLFLNLRAKSIGEIVSLIVNCECGEKIETEINLNDVRVTEDKNNDNIIMIRNDIGLKLRYPTFEESILLSESKKDIGKIFDVISDCVEAVFDKSSYKDKSSFTKEEVNEFILQMTKEEFSNIEKFYLDMPKVVQDIEVKCPKCEKITKTYVTMGKRHLYKSFS